MAPFTDIPGRKVIYMPAEAIRAWKKALDGGKYPVGNFPPNWINICLSFFFAGLATSLAMFVCLWIYPFDNGSGMLSDNYMSAIFGVFLVTCAISAILALRATNEAEAIGRRTGYSKGIRTMILFGTNQPIGIDPDDCDVEGVDDTHERKYLIVKSPPPTAPEEKAEIPPAA